MRKFLAVVCIALGVVFICAAFGAFPRVAPMLGNTLAALFMAAAARHWVRTW